MKNGNHHSNGHASRLLPSFLIGGFECSSPINRHRERIDEIRLTEHDRYVLEDYYRLREIGIRTVREGVRWNLVDTAGQLDFHSITPFIEAAEDTGMTVIWDLFHYGFPDDLSPSELEFKERFARYCAAFALLIQSRGSGDHGQARWPHRFYSPVNEISFFAWAGGEVGMFAPHQVGRGGELKKQLVAAAIAGIDAIRRVDARARIVNCDPIVRVVAPAERPDLHSEAEHFNENCVMESWDMLSGRCCPELGGSPQHLDILGVNYYGINQWEHTLPENVLDTNDPRRVPLSRLLEDLHQRYKRPIILTETASTGDARATWIREMGKECRLALASGVPLHGFCIYPVIGMTEWHSDEFVPMGLWDRCPLTGESRLPHSSSIAEAIDLQRQFSESPLPSRLSPWPLGTRRKAIVP